MTEIQYPLEETKAIRHVENPTSVPCFRSVSRIWHFPSGAVLLELAERRDCLLPDIDRIDVPASGSQQISRALVLDTDTTVRVVEDGGDRLLVEFDREILL